MKYDIRGLYKVGKVIEFSVDIGDFNYLVIYGRHINGYFCAVPNWGWGCEMGKPDSIMYNKDKLVDMAGVPEHVAPCIADAIQEVWDNV